ncbi:hypothetical protein E2562_027251 [Oryza meyeriana var. granulata]|uniref:Protein DETOXIFICATION n=1 Tax=Oryza meyeriana var. granulata TaxID=110450 RepID=A0A6G1CUZ9_9ORYZ|nr:hypothetical protein E2562_027251 [Oryza meyeriana var. granulata]
MLLLTAVSVPLAVVWFYTGDILLLFGQDADIAAEAGAYARWMIPALFAYGPLQCHVRFLQTQNVVLPVMAAAGAAACCHLPVCWVLVYAAGMGSRGAALGNAISYWINVAILAVYVRVSSSCKKTWTGFSMEAFRDPLSFFLLAVPSALVVLNTANCLFMIPFGLGVAISIRVSNELGAGRPRAARLAVRVVTFLATLEGLAMALVLVCVRYLWGHAYSNEEKVWLEAFYVVGVPAAYLTAFVLRAGGMGLWMGIICGVAVQALLFMAITLRRLAKRGENGQGYSAHLFRPISRRDRRTSVRNVV